MNQLKKKVNRLKKGATIGIISPSWSGPAKFPIVYEKGLSNLREYFNFNIKEYPHTRSEYSNDQSYIQARVSDIHNAFLDPEVDAIFLSIGGDDSIRLLPFLNKEIILNNPKIILGFSDSTTLLIYLVKLGIPTFHGPSVMAGFSEPDGLPVEFIRHFESFFFDNWDIYKYKNYSKWTEDRSCWTDPEFLSRKKKYLDNTGPSIVFKEKTEGYLLGGCIEIIEMLKGTPFGISLKDWDNALFFFETSEEKPSANYVKYALRSAGVIGAWDLIGGLLIGKSKKYTAEEYSKLEEFIKEILLNEFNVRSCGIISNLDIGHTQPMHILPLGCRAKFDFNKNSLILLESPFK
jgi:muramoyltetrapeptide carboxypeptidase LdcA involved in peptidoglycan recycling